MKKVVLTIMDGLGYRKEAHGNAVVQAHPEHLIHLFKKYPHSLLEASGSAVGLPNGQMGNSEVGHMNIGAGRIVYQPLEQINQSIDNQTFFENETLLETIRHCKENHSALHLMGLISDGGVHSHLNHLLALLDLCKRENVEKLYLHLFTDGRDVAPKSAYTYIEKVEEKLKSIGIGTIATISGRYYAMDRDNNYDRLKKAYDAIVHGVGKTTSTIKEYIASCYEKGITDEFLLPQVFEEEGTLKENDGIIVFNYRKDRLRELFTAITNPNFNDMEVVRFHNVKVVTMFPVVASVKAEPAFSDPNLTNILGEYVEKKGLSQLRIAETEKYAHVTFFFDGGKERDYQREKKILIPSPKVATYDLKPEMSAEEVTEALIREMEHYDLIILNYANCDMVGHTGMLDKAIEAVKAVDENVGRLYEKCQELGFTMFITADHGNAEIMADDEGNVVTSHTTSKVPLIVTDEAVTLQSGKLADIAPTILSYMGLEVPEEMTGNILIEEN